MKKLLQLFILLVFVKSNSQVPIQEFNFNSSLSNTAGTASFTTNLTNLFGSDRNGVANGALRLQGVISGGQHYLEANLTNLPVGNAARSVSVWLKCSSFVNNTNIYPLGYGTQAANQAFGIQQNSASTSVNPNRLEVYGFGAATNNIGVVATPVQLDQWYHYVITHDGVNTTKIYRNNSLLLTTTKTWNTLGTIVTVGKIIAGTYNDGNAVNGFIDDLKIYNSELTAAQVANLYNPASTAVLPVISNVSSSLIHEGANISYTVNAGGASTTTTVLYGQTVAANELAATGTTATGTTNTACTATTQYNLSAAAAGTTMYYRIQATNSAGTVFSPTLTYTQVAKPTYEVNAPTNITTSASQINYVLKPNGGNSTSVVKYGLSASSLNNTATGFSALGFTDNFSNVQLTGLTPNTLYYYVVEGTNAYGVSQSAVATFTTQGNAPTFGYIGAGATSDAANIVFDINTGGANTTTTVNYGTSSSNLNLNVAGPTVNTTVNTSQTVNLTGLQPSTTYYFNIVAVGNGSTTSNTFSFTTSAAVSFPTPIYNFEFNNNLQSQDGSVVLGPFVGGSTSYVSNGTVANGALQVNEARCQNSLPNLPLGASNRSVHVRLRFASGTLSQDNFVFNWGTASTGQAFAYTQSVFDARLLGWGGSGYDYILAAGGVSFGQWYEYVFTYNGTSLSIYRDGNLLGSTPATLNTTGDIFRIGVSNSGIQKLQADIDYIRIFNQALTTSQVSSLYANPALSNNVAEINNFKFNLYPNPASDILNIEFNEAIKSVEIYSLQGQKVIETNQTEINISNLASGMYIVKVQDLRGSFATKKLIIE